MKGLLRWWPEPSVLRRVVLSLLGAFFVVWGALVATDYGRFKTQAFNQQALHSAQMLVDLLRDASAHDAALTVQVTESFYNRSRRASGLQGVGELLFVLEDGALGQRVYASTALVGQTRPADIDGVGPVQLGDRNYWLVHRKTARWDVYVFEPVLSDLPLLLWLSQDQFPEMLLAFPLVLLPIWLAVWRGLRPLRALSTRVASRDPNDVSDLGLTVRDAELRPLVAAFNQLLAKARQGMARERAFVQDAAHELRTPLAVLTAQAHALTAAPNTDAQGQAKVALEHAVARASHLVHQLLTLARVEGAQKAQWVNLVEVTRQVLIAAAPLAQERRVEVSLESPDQLSAHVNMASYFTIVDNLLRNALAYCPEGARVELQLNMVERDVCLAVRDDGPGIAATDLPHLFERFHRGRDVQTPGSGLGLAIVLHAAQTMGGTVVHEVGLDGRGASFVVRFPAVLASN